jgi:dehydrodolichyl diphosphate syntase complex subunit NUS1
MAATGLTAAEEAAFRRKQLSIQQREDLLKPFLPSEPLSSSESASRSRNRASAQKSKLNKKAGPVKSLLYFATYHLIALLFSIFFRFRRAFRLAYTKFVSLLKYHHRTPEFIAGDVAHLEKLPKHLSVIVELNDDDEQQGNAGLEGLVNDVCEIAAWASAAGITFLSVYERTGRHSSFYTREEIPPSILFVRLGH